MAGSGGKGGGAAMAPVLNGPAANDGTPTYTDKDGTAMVPMNGPGGASPMPLDQYNATYGGAAPATPTAPAGFNINDAASNSMRGAIAGTNAAMGPLNVGAYMNPYNDAVINRTQQDIARQQQMATNQLDAQASAAGAFGGSRHGVAQGVMAGEYGRAAGDIFANQRQAGYNTAFNNAMADRGQRLGAASQLGALGNMAFNTGRTINQDLLTQGLLQQSLQQALLDRAAGDMANYASGPLDSLSAPLAALGASPKPTTTTQTNNPGILGTLGALKYMNIL